MITNTHYYKVVPVTTPKSDTLKAVLYYAGPNIVRVSFCHDLKELQDLMHYAKIVGYEEVKTNEIAEEVICDFKPNELFDIAQVTKCQVLTNNTEYGIILFGKPDAIKTFKGLIEVKANLKHDDIAEYRIYQVGENRFSIEVNVICNRLSLNVLQDTLDILGFKDKTPED